MDLVLGAYVWRRKLVTSQSSSCWSLGSKERKRQGRHVWFKFIRSRGFGEPCLARWPVVHIIKAWNTICEGVGCSWDVLDEQTELVIIHKPWQRTNPVHDHWATGWAFVKKSCSHLTVCLDDYPMTWPERCPTVCSSNNGECFPVIDMERAKKMANPRPSWHTSSLLPIYTPHQTGRYQRTAVGSFGMAEGNKGLQLCPGRRQIHHMRPGRLLHLGLDRGDGKGV